MNHSRFWELKVTLNWYLHWEVLWLCLPIVNHEYVFHRQIARRTLPWHCLCSKTWISTVAKSNCKLLEGISMEGRFAPQSKSYFDMFEPWSYIWYELPTVALLLWPAWYSQNEHSWYTWNILEFSWKDRRKTCRCNSWWEVVLIYCTLLIGYNKR